MKTEFFTEIKGKNLSLINLNIKYLNDMWDYSSNPLLYEHFEFEPQKKKYDVKKYLIRLIERSNDVDAHWWFIQINKSKKVIGSLGYHDYDSYRKSCEISYALSPNFWGKGIFNEALHMALNFLINDFNIYRVTATTSSENIRSIKALKKVGFSKEGEFRDFYLKNGTRFNATYLSLLASDYIVK